MERIARKKATGFLLFDIERAFDRSWHDGIVFKMLEANLPIWMVRFAKSYLQGRTIRVKLEHHKSEIRCGV